MFERYNRNGAAVTLLVDGEEIDLGPGVEFRVLHATEDNAGGVDFWLMWKALGYQEGPQFTHTVRIVSAAAGEGELRIADDAGQVLVLAPYADQDRWRAWQEYRRANAQMFARADTALLDEARRTATARP